MQPRTAEHARFLHSRLLPPVVFRMAGMALLLVITGAGLGCQSASYEEASQFSDQIPAFDGATGAQRDSILAVLESMQRTHFDSAFVRLRDYDFTRTAQTEQLDPTGDVTAARLYMTRFRGDETDARTLNSRGTFDEGTLDVFGTSETPTRDQSNVATAAFPDEPAYVSARGREAFAYRFDETTLPNGEPSLVVQIRARDSEEGRTQPIRYARLVMEEETRELLAAETIRYRESLLYDEDSYASVLLQPAPEDENVWLPEVFNIHARVTIPFREAREYRTESRYQQYSKRQDR